MCQSLSLNKMENSESAAPKGEGKAATGRQPPPLKTLEDISCIIESPKRKKRDTKQPRVERTPKNYGRR